MNTMELTRDERNLEEMKKKVHVIALLVTAFVFTMMHTPASVISFSRFMIVDLFIGFLGCLSGNPR